MQISDLIALFRRKMSEPPQSSYEAMRDALKPQKERALPVNAPAVPSIKKRA
jgi:hypothetical protein